MRVNHVHNKIHLNTVLQLQHMIERHNPYVTAYRTAKERLDSEEHISLCLKTVDNPHLDQRRYTVPVETLVHLLNFGFF